MAKEAIENSWTFIYLKSPELLARTLQLSQTLDKNGHGVIVFVEDIDKSVIKAGDLLEVEITDADEYDLFAKLIQIKSA